MKQIALFALGVLLLSITGCKKDSNNPADWAADIAGHYTNSNTLADIVVNRIDDTHISIAVEDVTFSYNISAAFTNVTMNSATSFTLNPYTDANPGCDGTLTYTGTGTASNNNISLFLTVTANNQPGPNDPCISGTENISASK